MKVNRFALTDIRKGWDLIADELFKLKQRGGYDWRPEDVYARCLFGKAFLWLGEEGFMICYAQENQFTLENELFLWIGVSYRHDSIHEFYDDICLIAKSVGATKIVFESTRPGFAKIARENHWKGQFKYTVEVR